MGVDPGQRAQVRDPVILNSRQDISCDQISIQTKMGFNAHIST
jgi:hypothetical protein